MPPYLVVNVIKRSTLKQFWQKHPHAKSPLVAWYKLLRRNRYANFNELSLDLAFVYANDWEEQQQKNIIPEATPREMLEFLMQQNNLKQTDLEKAGIADQALLSNILNGKRNISIALAKRLGAYFRVSSG